MNVTKKLRSRTQAIRVLTTHTHTHTVSGCFQFEPSYNPGCVVGREEVETLRLLVATKRRWERENSRQPALCDYAENGERSLCPYEEKRTRGVEGSTALS